MHWQQRVGHSRQPLLDDCLAPGLHRVELRPRLARANEAFIVRADDGKSSSRPFDRCSGKRGASVATNRTWLSLRTTRKVSVQVARGLGECGDGVAADV